jgi:hypothetical protein
MAGRGAQRFAFFLGGDGGGIGAERLGRAVVRAGMGLVEREIGDGMLGGVLPGAQEDREQRPAETDRGGADRQRVEAERLGLGGLVGLGLGHGLRPICNPPLPTARLRACSRSGRKHWR